MNSASFLNMKCIRYALLLAGLTPSLLWSGSKDKDKEGYPDYTRLEYAKPLPPVDEQVKQPKPGSISRKFGEVPEDPNQGADPLNSIPIPLMRGNSKGNDFEPPITEILEESDLHSSTTTAREPVKTSTVAAADPAAISDTKAAPAADKAPAKK